MKMTKIMAGLLATGIAVGACADALLLSEGFDNVAALGAAGWVFTNASAPVGQPWFQGNNGIFSAQLGVADSYVGVNFNSTSAVEGVVDNWLISPELSVGAGSSLTFYTRAADAGFLDLLEVRFSSGASTALLDFSTLLETVGDAASYPADDWVAYTLTLPTATSGRFAFRYSVANALDASYIGIDSVTVSAVNAVPVPAPATLLLVGVGLAAAFGVQRRKALVAL
jgi:hypothetical protein